MVKIYTTKKHRFNRVLAIAGANVNVDGEGYAEVAEDIVSQALIAGFELVDKNAKFASEEEKTHVKEVNAILESAKAEANAIREEAKAEAAKIIADAEAKAGLIEVENKVDEKAVKREELASKKVGELKGICQDSGIPEEEWKTLKKEELVDLLMSFIFEESK